jgi:hypothetical protein
MEASDPKHAADSHYQRKGNGKYPNLSASHLCSPDADGKHCKQVIESKQRMLKSAGKPSRYTGSRVSRSGINYQ